MRRTRGSTVAAGLLLILLCGGSMVSATRQFLPLAHTQAANQAAGKPQQKAPGALKGPLGLVKGPVGLVKRPVGLVKRPVGVVKGPVAAVNGQVGVVKGPVAVVKGPVAVVKGPVAAVKGPVGVVKGSVGVVKGPVAVVKGPVGVAPRVPQPQQQATSVAGALAPVVCAAGNSQDSCKALSATSVMLQGNRDQAATLQADSYFLAGSFSFNAKLQQGGTGDVVTLFTLSNADVETPDSRNYDDISMTLHTDPISKNAILGTQVISDRKHTDAQFMLPFDGSVQAHKYSVSWSQTSITWFVDNKPIRILWKNRQDPWPQNALRPQIKVLSDPSLDPPGIILASPKTTTLVDSFTAFGCLAQADDVTSACAASNDATLAWNRPLTAAQMVAYNAWHYEQVQFQTRGWDKYD